MIGILPRYSSRLHVEISFLGRYSLSVPLGKNKAVSSRSSKLSNKVENDLECFIPLFSSCISLSSLDIDKRHKVEAAPFFIIYLYIIDAMKQLKDNLGLG